MDAAVLDFSCYENECDPLSDALIADALSQMGIGVRIIPLSRGQRPPAPAPYVWLRYDLRCPEDLAWIIECAVRLRLSGASVFPSPEALLLAEDKWLTDWALRQRGLPLPDTWLGGSSQGGRFPLILKPRVGWGGEDSRIIHSWDDLAGQGALHPGYIAQVFIPNDRTLITAVADGQPIVCIEDRTRTGGHSCRARTVPFTEQAVDLAHRAIAAVGLTAGTVDLIETPEGLCVLEVNSAPRLTYPALSGVDLAGPMARAVIKGWQNGG